jgi:hypothetical protein
MIILLYYFPSQHVKNSLTFMVYNEFIGLGIATCFSLWNHSNTIETNKLIIHSECEFLMLCWDGKEYRSINKDNRMHSLKIKMIILIWSKDFLQDTETHYLISRWSELNVTKIIKTELSGSIISLYQGMCLSQFHRHTSKCHTAAKEYVTYNWKKYSLCLHY